MSEKFPGSKNPHELSALEKEVALQGAESFEQLYAILDKIGPVTHGSESYTPAQLKAKIEKVRSGGNGMLSITHTYGLRKAVVRISRHEESVQKSVAPVESTDTHADSPDAPEFPEPIHTPEVPPASESIPAAPAPEHSQEALTPAPAVQIESTQTQSEGRTSEGRNTHLERVSGGYKDETPGEFRKIVGGMLDKIRGLKAVSRTELVTPPTAKILEVPDAATPLPEHSAPQTPESAAWKMSDVAEKAGFGEQREAMKTAEAAYLAKYKEFYKTRKSLLDKPESDPEVSSLKRAYNARRSQYEFALDASAKIAPPSPAFKSRMEGKFSKFGTVGADGVKYPPKPTDENGRELSFGEYLNQENDKRNEALAGYIRFREVKKPAAEKRRQARVEALSEKGQNAFQKGLSWAGNKNRALEEKFGKNGARAIKLLAVPVVGGLFLSAGAAAAGTASTAALLGIAGWGTVKFGRAVVGFVAGTAAGQAAAVGYEKLIGKKAQLKAKESLKTLGREEQSLLPSDYDALDDEREKLIGRADQATLENKKNLVRALVAFGAGASTAAAFAEVSSLQHAAHALGATPDAHNGHVSGGHEKIATARSSGSAVSHEKFDHHPSAAAGQESPAHTTAPAHPGAPAQPATAPIPPNESLEVGGRINNANRLLGHFADKLQTDFKGVDAAHMPKSVSAYLDIFKTDHGISPLGSATENHASLLLGLRDAHGLSEVMHPGDAISLNSQGQVVINWADHARAPHVLVDAEGTPNTNFDDLGGSHMHGIHHAAAEHVGSRAASAGAPSHTTGPDASDALNHAQAAGARAADAATRLHEIQEKALRLGEQQTQHVPEATPTHTPEVPVAPDQSTVENLLHSFTNPLGTPVDPAVPHIYDGGGTGHDLVIYGGTPDEQVRAAEMFIAKPENVRKTVWVEYMRTSQLTGTQELVARAFSADEHGLASMRPVHPGEGYMPKIDPAVFVRRIT